MAIVVKNTRVELDSDNQIVSTVTEEKSIKKDQEPNYIKIYTAMFFEFKQFPVQYRELFLQLAMHMTYCNSEDLDGSQLVCVSGHIKKSILSACGWNNDSSLARGLKKLCDCGAIRRVAKGQYQVNPEFAGKGAWKFDSKLKQGGIKDLIANFRFSDNSVNTAIIYNDEDTYGVPDQITYTVNPLYVAATQSELDVIATKSSDDVEQS